MSEILTPEEFTNLVWHKLKDHDSALRVALAEREREIERLKLTIQTADEYANALLKERASAYERAEAAEADTARIQKMFVLGDEIEIRSGSHRPLYWNRYQDRSFRQAIDAAIAAKETNR